MRLFHLILIACLLLPTVPEVWAKDDGLINHAINDPLPSFKLKETVSGHTVAINTADGKPSVIMFFSIKPIFREKRSLNLAEVMDKLSAKFAGRAKFTAVFSDSEKVETLKGYISDGLIKTQVLDDSEHKIYNRYGVFMLPLAVVISGDGKLQSVIPYTYGIEELLGNNLKLLLGDWSEAQFKQSLAPKKNIIRSKEEKEYIRRVNYGRVMSSRRMYPAAIREYSTAAKIMPKATEALVGLGDVYLAVKNWNKAEKAFQRALAIDKDSDNALAGLGLTIYGQGHIEKATPILENAIISENPSLQVIVALAEIYEKSGKIDKAVRLNKLAISRLLKR